MDVADGDAKDLTAERNGGVSYWWRARGGFPPRRPSLPGPASADVCIVGAGFTGLWTAYYLKKAEPSLRIVVLETIGDSAHVYMYAQRTADGRIAIGGRGVPYRFASGVDHRGVTQPAAIQTLGQVLRALFPAAARARIDHAWCGVLGVPRDWCATVRADPASGLGWAGSPEHLAVRAVHDHPVGVPPEVSTICRYRWAASPWSPSVTAIRPLCPQIRRCPPRPRSCYGYTLGICGVVVG